MLTQKFLAAWLSTSLIILMLAGLWYQLFFINFYAHHTADLVRDDVNLVAITVGILLLGLLMTYVYPFGYRGGPTILEGLRFGMLAGAFWFLPWAIVMHGIWEYPLILVIVDGTWHLVEEGIAGIVLALVYGPVRTKQKSGVSRHTAVGTPPSA